MRERKWTVRGLTGTLVLFWATGGVFGQAPGLAGNKPAASVNGEVITMAELEAALKQDGPMPVALPESVRKQQQQVALSALIDKELLRQFLKQSTPPIAPNELEAPGRPGSGPQAAKQDSGRFLPRTQSEPQPAQGGSRRCPAMERLRRLAHQRAAGRAVLPRKQGHVR